jgi:putative phage-type endonuclease
MRIVDCEQGTEEWHEARSKIITGSKFELVMPKSKKFTTGTYTYMNEVAAEILTGKTADEARSKSLSWGKDNEDNAVNTYAALRNIDVYHIGICIDDELRAGASPDGFVGDEGMIECKCPYVSGKHINTLFEKVMPPEYKWQVQGNLMLNGRKWCDFISFDPRIKGKNKIAIIRVERDEKFIAELRSFIIKFNTELDEKLASIGVKYINPTLEESK